MHTCIEVEVQTIKNTDLYDRCNRFSLIINTMIYLFNLNELYLYFDSRGRWCPLRTGDSTGVVLHT